MTFHDRLHAIVNAEDRMALEKLGDTCVEAGNLMRQQQDVLAAASQKAFAATKTILSQLCESEAVPMNERAAWSAAFHSTGRTAEVTLDGFVLRAESYAARLAKIDAQLREPNAPMLAFVTGLVSDPSKDALAMQYTYRVSDGRGLVYKQHYNDRQRWHYHYVEAGEQPRSDRLDPFMQDDHEPLIDDIPPHILTKTVAEPEVAAEMLRSKQHDPTKVFVIGNQAVNAMFAATGSHPHADMLLGHAVHFGFRPEF